MQIIAVKNFLLRCGMDILQVIPTSVFSFIALFILTKLMGHKQVSQLDFFDYITGITIGSIAAELATDLEAPWKSTVAMVIYALATIIIGVVTRKIPKAREYLNGASVKLIDNGKLIRENLKKAKLDLNEFLMMCREKGYFDIRNIHTALFESNGKLTILPFSSHRSVTPDDLQIKVPQESLFAEIIMDGRVMEKNLKQLGLDLTWLSKKMDEHNIKSASEVFLAVCDRNKNIAFYKKYSKSGS